MYRPLAIGHVKEDVAIRLMRFGVSPPYMDSFSWLLRRHVLLVCCSWHYCYVCIGCVEYFHSFIIGRSFYCLFRSDYLPFCQHTCHDSLMMNLSVFVQWPTDRHKLSLRLQVLTWVTRVLALFSVLCNVCSSCPLVFSVFLCSSLAAAQVHVTPGSIASSMTQEEI